MMDKQPNGYTNTTYRSSNSLASTIPSHHPKARSNSINSSPNKRATKGELERKFQKRVENLQARSRQRFQNQWDAILDKYSQIDDEKESDEIDLSTGEITIDNGHLRSLTRSESLPTSLGDIWGPQSETERKTYRYIPKTTSNGYSTPPRRPTNLNERRNSNALRDNVLLLSPSPSKKSKPSPYGSGSPSAYAPSPTRIKFDHEKGSNSPSPMKLNGLMHDESFVASPSRAHDNPFLETTSSSEKDSRTYIELDLSAPSTSDVYQCAFTYCEYCTGNRKLYAIHLLNQHSSELKAIGYPVKCEPHAGDLKLSFESTKELKKSFPLNFDKIRDTRNLVRCNVKMAANKRCRCVFFNLDELKSHHEDSTNCDSRIPIYVCPFLGCDFKNDQYHELQKHIENCPPTKSYPSGKSRSILLSNHDLNRRQHVKILDKTDSSSQVTKDEIIREIDSLFDSD